jgi:hypothetical protein
MLTAADVQSCNCVNQTLTQSVIFLVCLLLNSIQLGEASIPMGSKNLKSACVKGMILSECRVYSSVLMRVNCKMFWILTFCDHSF